METRLPEDVQLVRVFATDDIGRYLFAKSLLDDEGIEYVAKGEVLRNATGWTPIGWIDTVRGPAELWVRSDDVDRVRSLLRALDAPNSETEIDPNRDA